MITISPREPWLISHGSIGVRDRAQGCRLDKACVTFQDEQVERGGEKVLRGALPMINHRGLIPTRSYPCRSSRLFGPTAKISSPPYSERCANGIHVVPYAQISAASVQGA
jgi:hypothetical protein